jgi:hypothetical protein
MVPESAVRLALDGFVRPFPLGEAPLFRVGLLPWSAEGDLLLFDMHHSITDGVSAGILIREFASLYAGETLPPLRLQYRDYACWQAESLRGEEMRRHEAYWLEKLAGPLPDRTLPFDFARPKLMDQKGASYGFGFDPGLSGSLRALALDHGASLAMALMALVEILLHRYSGSEDVIVGTAVAGRPHADLQDLIGMFINVLPIRSRVDPNAGFGRFLGQVRQTMIQAYEHQDFPFEMLVEKLNLGGSLSRNPIFSVMFTMQNFETPAIGIPGLEFVPLPVEGRVAHGDMNIMAQESGGGIRFALEYSTALFRPETIAKMGIHLERLARAAVRDPSRGIADLEILTEGERESLRAALGVPEGPVSGMAGTGPEPEGIYAEFDWNGGRKHEGPHDD